MLSSDALVSGLMICGNMSSDETRNENDIKTATYSLGHAKTNKTKQNFLNACI